MNWKVGEHYLSLNMHCDKRCKFEDYIKHLHVLDLYSALESYL